MIYELDFMANQEGKHLLRSFLFQAIINYKITFMELTKEDHYSLLLNGEEDEILSFCNDISNRIPLSMNFRFLEFKNVDYPDFTPCAVLETPQVLDVLTIQDVYDNPESVMQYLRDFQCSCKEFEKMMQTCIEKLRNNDLAIKTALGIFKFGINKEVLSKGNASKYERFSQGGLVFWDISMLKTHMRAEKEQIEILASFEKPSTMLMPKEIFYNDLGSQMQECILPFDIFLSVLARYCLESQISFSFFTHTTQEPFVSYDQDIPQSHKIVLSKDGFILYDEMRAKDLQEVIGEHIHQLGHLTEGKDRLQAHSLVLFLSKSHQTFFWLKDNHGFKSIVDFCFETSPSILLEEILQTKDGDKLCENFKKSFPELFEKMQDLRPHEETKNIFVFLDTLARILGFQNAEKLLNHTHMYLRDKGPRIDYKIARNANNELEFTYISLLKSAMSFKIAGVDDETLCYGILDSMGEFFGNLIGDMGINFHAKKVLICGSFLQEKILLDRILHYMPKNMEIILPKAGFLDYIE